MVAYSFKAQFATPILAGTKQQTIRAHRKRHARVGETLQLYTGMRTKHCRLIGRATCESIQDVRLSFINGYIITDGDGPARVLLRTLADCDAFARRDGFQDWKSLAEFWEANHPGTRFFNGVLIFWGGTLTTSPAPISGA